MPFPEKCGSTISFQATHVLLLTFGLTIHELSITGGFYFSHSELVNIILLSVECWPTYLNLSRELDSPTYWCHHQPIHLCSLIPRLPWPRYICRRGHIQVFSLGSPTPSLRSLASSRPYLSQRWHKLWVMSMCHMELPSKRRGQHFQLLNHRNDIDSISSVIDIREALLSGTRSSN